jgi:hypothetical protein
VFVSPWIIPSPRKFMYQFNDQGKLRILPQHRKVSS